MIERRGKGSLRLCSWERDKDKSISIREEVLLSISVIGVFLFLSITYITFLPLPPGFSFSNRAGIPRDELQLLSQPKPWC